MDEGGTNMLWAERFGRSLGVDDLWIKQCGNSHTGSFKDLGMTVLVSRRPPDDGARARRFARSPAPPPATPRRRSRPTAAAAGIPAIVILPRGKVSVAQLLQPLANGALVLALDTDFDGCMAHRPAAGSQEEGVYLANSMNSLRLEGQKTVAIEIVQQWDWEVPDVVVIPGGNLGNVSALGAGFDMMRDARPDREEAAHRRGAGGARQSALSAPTRTTGSSSRSRRSRRSRRRSRSAIPVSVKKAIRTLQRYDGIVEQATEAELADASAAADRTGMFNCPHTGVALAVLTKLVERGDITLDRSRRGDLDGERPEVHRLQAAVPRGRARGRRPDARAVGRWSCRTTTTRCGGRSTR